MLKLCEPDSDLDSDEIGVDYETEQILINHQLSKANQRTSLNLRANNTIGLHLEAISRHIETDYKHREEENNQSNASAVPHKDELSMSAHSVVDNQAACGLHHEFSLLNTNMPHVEINMLDAVKRFAIFKISVGGHIVVLEMLFPIDYPKPSTAPEFCFGAGTTLRTHILQFMLKLLKNNALQRVKKSRTCIEQCLKALVAALKKVG